MKIQTKLLHPHNIIKSSECQYNVIVSLSQFICTITMIEITKISSFVGAEYESTFTSLPSLQISLFVTHVGKKICQERIKILIPVNKFEETIPPWSRDKALFDITHIWLSLKSCMSRIASPNSPPVSRKTKYKHIASNNKRCFPSHLSYGCMGQAQYSMPFVTLRKQK